MDTFEKIAYKEGYQLIAGVDEAGRGPLAGPVVAAAVILPSDYVNAEINDSKQLSAGKREKLYEIINKDAVAIGMGIVDTETIDHINILQSNSSGHARSSSGTSHFSRFSFNRRSQSYSRYNSTETSGKRRRLKYFHRCGVNHCQSIPRPDYGNISSPVSPIQFSFKIKVMELKNTVNAIKQFGICKIHRKSFHVKNLNQTSLEFTY